MLRLWGIVLAANIVGCFLFACALALLPMLSADVTGEMAHDVSNRPSVDAHAAAGPRAPSCNIVPLGDTQMTAHIILFEHANFHGAHKHVFLEEANLNADDDKFFNDKTSSFVIV